MIGQSEHIEVELSMLPAFVALPINQYIDKNEVKINQPPHYNVVADSVGGGGGRCQLSLNEILHCSKQNELQYSVLFDDKYAEMVYCLIARSEITLNDIKAI